MISTLPAGYRRRAFDELASTNGEALAAAANGEASGLWITAAVQTAGRGRRGRAWSTDHGNLAASLLLVDPSLPALAPTLSFVAAIALHGAAIDVGGPPLAERLALKWPNDLLLDGRKVAGILVEGENLGAGRMVVVLGFGVNCESHPELDGRIAATDFAARGMAVPAEPLFVALAGRLAEALAVWNRGAGFAAIRAAWLQRAAGVGETIRVNLADRAVDGRFEALDDAGRLILVGTDGRREAFSAGDIFFAVAG